ncbi:MAG: hypothetical protein LUD74_07845 [Tannerellaceae bacterium]|nr:hypothetical protein [Tannerellaceae bacterium]
MEKKYKHIPDTSGESKVNEPIASYNNIEQDTGLPLTEEELKETITRDELLEYIFERIDKLPGK